MNIHVNLYALWAVIVLCQLRGIVRNFLNIAGNALEDGALSFFCAPCTIIQLVNQLWNHPHVVPGCDISPKPVHLV